MVASDTNRGRRLAHTLLLLTFTTGLIDAVSFLGLGRVFTALMTGNVVFTAFAFAGADGLNATWSLTALGAFLMGAALGGQLARRAVGRSQRAWLLRVAALEIALVLAPAVIGLVHSRPVEGPAWALYAAIASTAAAMGLRNATVLRLAVPDLKTTVLTLTLTGIAADSPLGGGSNRRLGWRIASVGCLFLGAFVGGHLVLATGIAAPLFLMAALVFVATFAFVRHPSSLEIVARKGSPPSPTAKK